MKWQLRDLLERHNLSAYQLAKQLQGKMNAGSVYTLARGETERVSLATLGYLLGALEKLTGTRYTAADLLAWDAAAFAEELGGEDNAWLTADLSRLDDLEPYDWGNLNPLDLGRPVSPGNNK